MNVILDLDATIIHSIEYNKPQVEWDLKHKMDKSFFVYERPHLQEFLDYLFANHKVAVWTAASKSYALFIIEQIVLKNPERKLEFVLFNVHGEMSSVMGKCSKDLRMVYKLFPSFTKHNTVIIDDYDDVFMPQLDVAYPILPFNVKQIGAKDDKELLKLMKKLIQNVKTNEKLISKNTLDRVIKEYS